MVTPTRGYPSDPVHLTVNLPNRSFLPMEGPLGALQTWDTDLGRGGPMVPPTLVCPADHAWIFISDVNPHWAGSERAGTRSRGSSKTRSSMSSPLTLED